MEGSFGNVTLHVVEVHQAARSIPGFLHAGRQVVKIIDMGIGAFQSFLRST